MENIHFHIITNSFNLPLSVNFRFRLVEVDFLFNQENKNTISFLAF